MLSLGCAIKFNSQELKEFSFVLVDPDSEFYWWGGSDSEYRNWGFDEPSGDGACAEVTAFDTWNDWKCDWTLGFVCKMEKCA